MTPVATWKAGVLPPVTSDLQVSVPAGGHLVSAYALGVVVGAPLLAVAAARLPRRTLLLLLLVAFTAGNVFLAVVGRCCRCWVSEY